MGIHSIYLAIKNNENDNYSIIAGEKSKFLQK